MRRGLRTRLLFKTTLFTWDQGTNVGKHKFRAPSVPCARPPVLHGHTFGYDMPLERALVQRLLRYFELEESDIAVLDDVLLAVLLELALCLDGHLVA